MSRSRCQYGSSFAINFVFFLLNVFDSSNMYGDQLGRGTCLVLLFFFLITFLLQLVPLT